MLIHDDRSIHTNLVLMCIFHHVYIHSVTHFRVHPEFVDTSQNIPPRKTDGVAKNNEPLLCVTEMMRANIETVCHRNDGKNHQVL